jgi:hypothetical protein
VEEIKTLLDVLEATLRRYLATPHVTLTADVLVP